jgi:hypothetical protein
MHGFDIFRVMALVGRQQPPPVMVFGVEPGLINWSMSLSPQVAASLPFLITAGQKELIDELQLFQDLSSGQLVFVFARRQPALRF